MTTRTLAAVAGAALGAGALVGAAEQTTTPTDTVTKISYDAPVALELTFNAHVEDDLAEQDVFIEREVGSGLVHRPTKGERVLNQPLYSTAAPLEHAPFDPDALGPWKRGKPLGITLGEWLSAEGKGTYTCRNGEGNLHFEFSKLVPNGIYTLWHFFMAWPPTEPFNGTYDLPVGSRDGSQSVFTAGTSGSAVVKRSFKPCLQLTGEHLAAGLALTWHSDGKTYGSVPGEFATDSHIHLYAGLPKRTGI